MIYYWYFEWNKVFIFNVIQRLFDVNSTGYNKWNGFMCIAYQ